MSSGVQRKTKLAALKSSMALPLPAQIGCVGKPFDDR
jgi:hypothetical protein